jgi:hypothetical protein
VIRFSQCPAPAIPSMKLLANPPHRQVRNRRGQLDTSIENATRLGGSVSRHAAASYLEAVRASRTREPASRICLSRGLGRVLSRRRRYRASQRTIACDPAPGVCSRFARRACSSALICSQTMASRAISHRSSSTVLGQRQILGCPQLVGALRRFAQFRIEAADPKPRQNRLHAIDDPRTLAH